MLTRIAALMLGPAARAAQQILDQDALLVLTPRCGGLYLEAAPRDWPVHMPYAPYLTRINDTRQSFQGRR